MPLDSSAPDLTSLDLFVSVVELGSISRAAAMHGMSQPSVSSRLRGLERRLGIELLTRSPSGSEPTDAGSLVAGWARTVLVGMDELTTGVAALRARSEGRLRIAASYTIAEYLLPAWLEQFLRNRPDDSVALVVANSTSVLAQLAAGTVDLGFIESPSDTDAMRTRVVADDELITVMSPAHGWARRGSVPIEALATTPLILREEGSGTRDALIAALSSAGFDAPHSALELGSTAAVRAAVIEGRSPAVLSRLAVSDDLDAGSLVEIEVPGLDLRRRLRAAWRTSGEPAPLARRLLAQLPDPDAGR